MAVAHYGWAATVIVGLWRDSAVGKKWVTNAPLRLRKMKELMTARFSVDVTSLVAPGLDQPAISDRGWILCARMRIGMALDAADSRPSAGCSVLMDPVGDYALCCSKVGLYARHNDLRDEFAVLCVEAGLAVELEKNPENLRPADVLVHGIDNSPLAVDFSVMHPLQPSADSAEVRPGTLARQMENSCGHNCPLGLFLSVFFFLFAMLSLQRKYVSSTALLHSRRH